MLYMDMEAILFSNTNSTNTIRGRSQIYIIIILMKISFWKWYNITTRNPPMRRPPNLILIILKLQNQLLHHRRRTPRLQLPNRLLRNHRPIKGCRLRKDCHNLRILLKTPLRPRTQPHHMIPRHPQQLTRIILILHIIRLRIRIKPLHIRQNPTPVLIRPRNLRRHLLTRPRRILTPPPLPHQRTRRTPVKMCRTPCILRRRRGVYCL
mmetsp:Transcript_27460/g.32475  ORF Transcript_27460/g.32475 Transcript_27460/m.32475 type:complete len:208 (-) Transcript_27460:562-1185(-)